MKITRDGETRSKGETTLLKETDISTLQFDDNQNLNLVFRNVQSPDQWNTTYEYVISLTPDDISKIVAEALKQAFTKKS